MIECSCWIGLGKLIKKHSGWMVNNEYICVRVRRSPMMASCPNKYS